MSDARQNAPATERNREPILEILRRVLPPGGTVLEISSGTGQHAVFFAPALAPRRWQPSEPDAGSRESIAAWSAAFPSANLLAPLALDVLDEPWPEIPGPLSAIVNINMIHIAPWEATLGFLPVQAVCWPQAHCFISMGLFVKTVFRSRRAMLNLMRH